MKKIIILLLLLIPIAINAQNATGASKFAWDQVALDLATANSYTYKYYPDGSLTGTTFTGVVCTNSSPSTLSCVVNIPAFTPGNHTVQITASNVAGESAKSSPFPFVFVVVPVAPVNIRLQ